MDRKLLTIILSLALIGCFFLPYSMGYSLYDYIFNGSGASWEIYIPLIIPVSALLLLIGALNNERYFIGRFIWAILPLLGVLYIPVRAIIAYSQAGMKLNLSEFASSMDYGFWALLGVSLILAVVHPKSRYS